MNTTRIIGLTVLALLSVSPIAMGTNPQKPVIVTQFFSQPVSFVPWGLQLLNATTGMTTFCGQTQGYPPPWTATYVIGYNFTTDVRGKDLGSVFINFKAETWSLQGRSTSFTPAYFNASFLSTGLYHAYCDLTVGSPNLNLVYTKSVNTLPIINSAIGSSQWRVTMSGTYSFIMLIPNCFCQLTALLPSMLPPITATETWTVTTVS